MSGHDRGTLTIIVVGFACLVAAAIMAGIFLIIRNNDLEHLAQDHARQDAETRQQIEQAQLKTEQTLCSFMATRARFPGEPNDTPEARGRNDALAREAETLLWAYGCP